MSNPAPRVFNAAVGSNDASGTAPVPRDAVELLRRARDGARKVLLIVYHRDGAEAVPLLPDAPLVVGREGDLAIVDPSLSRMHARFTARDGGVTVEDLGSTNGTWLRGRRVERADVADGDDVELGAVTASLHVLGGAEGAPRAFGGHDRFCAHLEDEIVRARFFGRPLSLLVVRSGGDAGSPMSRWHPAVEKLLRPVDRIARYSSGVLEILLPELGEEAAIAVARSVVAGAPGALVCGVASFPSAGTTAEGLLDACRWAAAAADAQRAVSGAGGGAARVVTGGANGAAPAAPFARSAKMREVLETAERIARSAIPVLLLGETGVGKEVVSRAIHEASPRHERPLVFVNCGAIPSQLVESTLFGHERGAFTGALSQHKGVFEAADGGTVLLDEIGELPAAAQAALLRVLETKRVTRVGSTREIEVEARVIAATHRDLEAMCDAGTFRVDLLYRLNAMTLAIPALRDRREDIVPLATIFFEQACLANGRALEGFDPDALDALERWRWPGNVRELKNAVERAVVIARDDVVTLEDLPDRVRNAAEAAPPNVASGAGAAPPPLGFREALQRREIELILDALEATGGSQTSAARRLEMPLRTLLHKMKTYGIKKLGYGERGSP